MKCARVLINNKLGLHARASAKLVSLPDGFKSEIWLKRDTQQINGKSIMGIMMLAAACGTEIELCAKGKDQDKAIKALSELIVNRFGEES
ncbi:MAG: HPr family phosphocarrier protein [Pseudomonadota bacterium]